MTPEATAFISPFFCGFTGTIIGLIVRDCIRTSSYVPMIVGSSVGGGIGCLMCIGMCMKILEDTDPQNRPAQVPVAMAVLEEDPVVHNVYVIYESGAAKDIPVKTLS